MCDQFANFSQYNNAEYNHISSQTWQDLKTDETAGAVFKPFSTDRMPSLLLFCLSLVAVGHINKVRT